jgi:prolyl oligopeptidase
MRRLGPFLATACLWAVAFPNHAGSMTYPQAPRGTQSSSAFGVQAPDPYRWLENDVRQDPAVKRWVEAQNTLTQAYLAKLPRRDAIKTRLAQLWDFEKFGLPVRKGGRYFFTRNSGLQNQAVLLVQDGLAGAPRALIDPNTWAQDGATALDIWAPSDDGSKLAYAIQDGGSDWRTLRVLDVATARPLADEIKWVKFSGLSWAKDGSGFYYSRFPAPQAGAEFQAPNVNQAVYFHRLGDAQSADALVYATPGQPQRGHGAQVSPDGRWLVITTYAGTDDRYEVTVRDLSAPASSPRTLVAGLEYSWALVGSQGTRLVFVTNQRAPRYRVVVLDAAQSAPQAVELVPETAGTLKGAAIVGQRMVLSYLEDAHSVVRIHTLDGRPEGSIALPGIGTAEGFAGEPDNAETFYRYSSFNAPPTLYRYDSQTGLSSVFKAPQTPFDSAAYQVTQQFFNSKDGTRVPMFVVHKKGLDLAKGAPTLLYGYGGFNQSLTPSFSISRLAWMEMGGVFALVNLRGGGEYGKAWHDGGRLFNKQNVFDDFIAAGESLVKSGVTTPRQLAVQGGSNGGTLVGAVVNQRPDLFAAALPAVGVMDMLRYNQFTAGRYWVDDYGDPADEKHFLNLLAYSPYHNVRGGPGRDYPAILVTTADTDDRVVPGHSFKYAAALQAAAIGDKPHLIRIETRAGHGSGKPTDKLIEEAADLWAFIGFHTGLTAGH